MCCGPWPSAGRGWVWCPGAGWDVAPGGELERAFLAGMPMTKVVYAGVGKSDAEIMAALDGRYSLLTSGERQRPVAPDRQGPVAGARGSSDRGPIGYFNIESEPEFETVAAIARKL